MVKEFDNDGSKQRVLISSEKSRRAGSTIRHLYVPVVSFVLLALIGHRVATSKAFDPLTAAQNQRIHFQTTDDASKIVPGDVTPAEASLAESVIETLTQKNYPASGDQTHLFYIGNSQTLAVMDAQPGDLTTPQWMQIFLARGKNNQSKPPVEVRLGSLPNLSIAEMLIRFVSAGEQTPRRADALLAAVVLEQFRTVGVREEVADAARSAEGRAALTSLVERNPELLAAHNALAPFIDSGTRPSAAAETQNPPKDEPLARMTERRLQQAVETVPLFAERPSLQGQVYFTYYDLRNRLLGITSASARPVPDATYQAGLQLIELALRYAQSKNIKAVFYLAPVRPTKPNPYLPTDLARLRHDLPLLCQRYNATCLDYMDLIPEKLWTNYPDDISGNRGQRDFAHFTGAAHKLLAEKLMTDVHLSVPENSTQEKR